MQRLDYYIEQINQIKEWEYCYCKDCDRIRYASELEPTEEGIRCSKCGGYDLESPAWVHCPHDMFGSAVKCARAGKAITREEYGVECKYRCSYRRF
jgi:hypothetical protein